MVAGTLYKNVRTSANCSIANLLQRHAFFECLLLDSFRIARSAQCWLERFAMAVHRSYRGIEEIQSIVSCNVVEQVVTA